MPRVKARAVSKTIDCQDRLGTNTQECRVDNRRIRTNAFISVFLDEVIVRNLGVCVTCQSAKEIGHLKCMSGSCLGNIGRFNLKPWRISSSCVRTPEELNMPAFHTKTPQNSSPMTAVCSLSWQSWMFKTSQNVACMHLIIITRVYGACSNVPAGPHRSSQSPRADRL
eukprot:SAG22_NODE_1948_length_3277_cov_1.569541_2_plen_168_part_00